VKTKSKTKQYALRLSIAILTFVISTAIVYFAACIKRKAWNPYKTTHSAENNSPYSVLEGTTVRIKPYNATFEIPESWLTPNPFPPPEKNLYLSYQDLNELYWNDGNDEQEAQVINSVLSIQDCAIHFGDKGWGNHFWNDLQGRVYLTDLRPEEVATRVEKQGLERAVKVFEGASVISGNHGKWNKRTLDIFDAPSWSDFALGKNLDFFYCAFGNKTVVIFFLNTETFDQEINLVLDSFKWPNGS
jgi:hypothetical protein